jgi:hypothetical protein
MNLKDLLKKGEPIFKKIDALLEAKEYDKAYQLIETSEPPSEWILELPSKSVPGTTYKTLSIDIMEAAMKRIFKDAYISEIKAPIISQDKGKFAVTVCVSYTYTGFNEGFFFKEVYGVATVVSPDISMLELATPKASTMAVKNAIKQVGALFGKYLNRASEDVDLPLEPAEIVLSPEELADDLMTKIKKCVTYDELRSYRLVVYDKKMPFELQNLYETRLRELANTAKSIG